MQLHALNQFLLERLFLEGFSRLFPHLAGGCDRPSWIAGRRVTYLQQESKRLQHPFTNSTLYIPGCHIQLLISSIDVKIKVILL